MKSLHLVAFVVAAFVLVALPCGAEEMRSMERSVLEDKILGGWVGQMVGVAYGEPTEFQFCQRMVEGPIDWEPDMVARALNQDDLYVEMTFAAVMDAKGLDATSKDYGDAFRDSKYALWHANAGARRCLNQGIDAPASGMPKNNMHANDIDFQIEADFIGLMAPGLPQVAIDLCGRVGRVMNSGDGLYGGMFVTGMYAAAFFETDTEVIVRAGLACIPEGSVYHRTLADTLEAYKANPDDWTASWKTINERWDKNESCPNGPYDPFNIDASLNGAYIALGLLYGGGDFARTLEVSTRCGQDSDCNPSNAAGILGVMHGFSGLDAKWTDGVAAMADEKFAHTDFSLKEIVASTAQRAEAAVVASGGSVEGDTLNVPRQTPKPPALEQWSMGPATALIKPNDPAWTWEGSWADDEGRPVKDVQLSETEGDSMELHFEGTGIVIVGYILPEMGGKAAVSLDGESLGEVNCYATAETWDTTVFHIDELDNGPHTLKLVTQDEVDPRAKGKQIPIDHAIVFTKE